jgi:secreted PhoX family phosphatase
MTSMDRRAFLGRGAAFAGAGLFSAGAVETLMNRQALAKKGRKGDSPYGPLYPSADRATGREILALPKAFAYTTFGYIGSTMSDGNITPLALDGMAAFPHPTDKHLVRLIRNHEDRNPAGAGSNAVKPGEADQVYDAAAGGGTSTLDFDPRGGGRLVRDFISLKGTIVNCAGGYSYGYRGWLTGEETTSTFGERHGYNFLVPVDREIGDPIGADPIVPMGRFSHEAVATDQRTGIVYQTDDPGSGVGAGFFRYIPEDPDDLFAGGRLQLLGIKGRPQADLRESQTVGLPLNVQWFDIDDVDPQPANNAAPGSVYRQGYDQGAAKFNRLEGCWWDGDRGIYFVSTSGGDVKNGDVNADGYAEGYGQVWKYTAGRNDSEGVLTLIYESDGAEALDSPDNMCVTPRGGLILCEDDASSDSDLNLNAPGIEDVNRLIGYGRDGKVFEFAVNRLNDSELAGATFSPDGKILFVNIFGDSAGTAAPYTGNEGMTIAITGPWGKGPL